jgi:dTDP-4-dehydrorhamnose 3,5-epimerase
MIFKETILEGAFVIGLEKREDERGFFARTWCRREFENHGLTPLLVQCSLSFNRKQGTLRGMHYQAPPCEEAKLVRCTRGAIYDVIIDMRPGSATYTRSIGMILSSGNSTMIYVPKGFAHGFLTLEDESEVFYQMSEFYAPERSRGVRWNDPAFGIEWPEEIQVISEQDRTYPDFGHGPNE